VQHQYDKLLDNTEHWSDVGGQRDAFVAAAIALSGGSLAAVSGWLQQHAVATRTSSANDW
jgi:hypothetical protein